MATTLSYRDQVLRLREDAIVSAVNRLLATKGYDLMTVDEVAAEAGLAKASLYKHFTSKEELAAAAMVRVLERAIEQVDALDAQPQLAVTQRLEAIVRWTLEVQLAGEMPSLPSQNSRLTEALRGHAAYMDRLLVLSDKLGDWILRAQAAGGLNPSLPAELVLFTLFARACDPVLGLLKAGGQYSDEQIIDWLVTSTFDGLGAGERRIANVPQPASRPARSARAR
ncbi:TetR/AcrR family transcriptional regulator [Caldimonas sp. KR1-144]|uniref:TetR/AcrR family transcriptional regulator n=1 Tax=Caldimonas sp. KR1-144 TaxID=3400911 RepID=UPI003C095B6E